MFVAAAVEFDDEPGAVRDELVRNQADLDKTIARVFRGGITARHFRDDADPEQFAFHMHGILLAFHQHSRLWVILSLHNAPDEPSTPCSMPPDPDCAIVRRRSIDA